MIRPYCSADRGQLIALMKLTIPQYFHPSKETEFAAYLNQHFEAYYIAEENGKIIGCGGINYFPEQHLARLSWDIIHPDFQGKGIGTKLTLYRMNQIRKNPAINLIVVRTTQLVYPFCQKMGFVLEKTEKDFWAEGFDLYQMRRDVEFN